MKRRRARSGIRRKRRSLRVHPAAPVLRCGAHALDLSRPAVMGVVNVTPDSFSDGGRLPCPAAAVDAAVDMVRAGAAIVDIGGESTRPSAEPVGAAQEIDRVVPVIEGLQGLDAPVSVDTSKAAVAKAAIGAGATLVNDVRAARSPGMMATLAAADVGVCLMHMRGEPRTMQRAPRYADVVGEVRAFLAERVAACRAAGIEAERLLLDPGIGFGKTSAHNRALLNALPHLAPAGLPVMVGVSRKRLIGCITGRPVTERLAGSVAAAVLAALGGAALVRVHDVPETVDALKMVAALGVPVANLEEPNGQ